MKKVMIGFIALMLLTPALSSAHHGEGKHKSGWHHGQVWKPAPPWRHNQGWKPVGPGRLVILPAAAATVIIGGLTYYVLNGSYYQRQHDNSYLVVEPPVNSVGTMQRLDYNGERFYVQGGHFYRRDINGQFYEVPRPAGL